MTSVTTRTTEMCLGSNGDQAYCFGDLPLSMWYVTCPGRLRRRCWGTVTLYSILRGTLVYTLSLTGWRLEPKCANVLHLYEEQKEQVVDTLQTLIDKLKVWGIVERAKWIQKDWWVCETLVLRVLRHHHHPVNNLSSLFSFKRTYLLV